MKHDWQAVYWQSGRWKGHRARQRQCPRCEVWETRRTADEECRGKPWRDLTALEKAAKFAR